MYSLIVAVLGLVIFLYMFDVLRKRSSVRTKRVGLAAWLGAGLLVMIYALVVLATRDGGMGFVMLLFMSLLFWVLPTGLLLWLDVRSAPSDNIEAKRIEK